MAETSPLMSEDTLARRLWEKKTLSDEDRMGVNGETKEMMEHIYNLKQVPRDTSVDQEWAIDESLWPIDVYVQIMTFVWIVPKFIIFIVPLYVTLFPFTVLARITVSCLPVPTDQVRRNACTLRLFVLLGYALVWPFALQAFLLLMFDYFFYYLFSIPFCLLTCGYGRYRKSVEVIKPWTNGPGLPHTDMMITMLGQSKRHGVFELTLSVVIMVLAIPWMKYFVQANPWLYPLEERFVQQIATSLEDVGVDKVYEIAREIISRCSQDGKLAHRLDQWKFVPHYPYPPPHRRWAVGMQKGGCTGSSLFVHTTHASSKALDSTEQFVLSNSVERPIWRVMLWYSNPYHFFTGFVEASISNGKESQLDKAPGGEHPMWLVTSRSPMASLREHWFPLNINPGQIDRFFDEWLPSITYETRLLALGKEAADARYQGVISKDGISRPDNRVGHTKYDREKVQPFSGSLRA